MINIDFSVVDIETVGRRISTAASKWAGPELGEILAQFRYTLYSLSGFDFCM
jgi:hypothetical protein